MGVRVLSVLSMLVAALLGSFASAESTVTLSDMHLCCGACVRGVEKAVQSVEGVTVRVDRKASEAVISAASDESAQLALNAIAKAGFHGSSNHKSIKIKDDSQVKAGQVSRLALTGVHNCCGGCNVAIKKALKSVEGVKDDTAKPKSNQLIVEGAFDGLAVVKALNKAGFHVVAVK